MTTAVFLPVPYLWSQVFTDAGVVGVGYQIFIYQAGTTVPITTFTDSTLTTQNPNPFQVSSNGRLVNSSGGTVEFWVPSGTLAKIILTDSTTAPAPGVVIAGGTFDNIAGINDVTLTAATIGAALYPVTTQEGTTVVNIGSPYGNIVRYGGGGGTDSTIAFQNALNSGYPVSIPFDSNGAYRMSAAVISTIPNTTVTLGNGAVLQWTQTTQVGSQTILGNPYKGGIVAQADGFVLQGFGKIIGPQTVAAGSGAGNGGVQALSLYEIAVSRVGPSANNRGTGFEIKDVEISLWGAGAVFTQYMSRVRVIDTKCHDCGYFGVMNLSSLQSRVLYNEVYGMAPGSGGNSYLITHSHDSTNYNTDPNNVNSPRNTVNPFCIDTEVAFNLCYDNPLWEGIDFHGSYEGRVHNNAIYNCGIAAIQMAAGSNNAANYAGENNSITNNHIYSQTVLGNNTTAASQNGITVTGGSAVSHKSVVVSGNTITGMGKQAGSPTGYYSINCNGYVQGFVIEGNTIKGGVGIGIYLGGNGAASISGVVRGNFFDSVGSTASNSSCIYIATNGGLLAIEGNIHNPISGSTTAYVNGLNTDGTLTTRCTISANDFEQATNPYVNISGATFKGLGDIPPLISSTATGSFILNLTTLGVGHCPIVYVSWGGASNGTLTDITGALNGQVVVITNTSGNTLTVNNTGGHIKLAGGSVALAQFQVLSLLSAAGTLCQFGTVSSNS